MASGGRGGCPWAVTTHSQVQTNARGSTLHDRPTWQNHDPANVSGSVGFKRMRESIKGAGTVEGRLRVGEEYRSRRLRHKPKSARESLLAW